MTLLITEAEYIALTRVVKEAIWLQDLMDDLGIEQDFLRTIVIAWVHLPSEKPSLSWQDEASTTLRGMFLKMEISRWRRFTPKTIPQTWLQRWFVESGSIIAKSCSESFRLLELSGAHLDELVWLDPLNRGYVGSCNGAAWSLKSRSCVEFAQITQVEIMYRFRQDRVSISMRLCVNFAWVAQAKIVCRFCRDRVSISPRIYWSLAQFEKSSRRLRM